MERLAEYARAGTLAELKQMVLSRFPEQARAMTPDAVDGLLRRTLRDALAAGCETKRDVALWVSLAMVHGPDFRAGPGAAMVREVLGRTNERMSSRLITLLTNLPEPTASADASAGAASGSGGDQRTTRA